MRPRKIEDWRLRMIGGIALFGLLLAFWQWIVIQFEIPRAMVPSPWEVLQAAFRERKTLAIAFGMTGAVSLLALMLSIVIGTTVAMAFSQSKLLRSAFYPYVIFLQTVPIVAIAPLLVTWFGYGFQTIVMVAVIISLFPIISNVTAGLTSVDLNLVELFKLNRASRWSTMWKLQVPFAVRSLIMGARVSAGMTVIGAIVGEFLVGDSTTAAAGLGTIISGWQRSLRTDSMIAAIFTSTLLGLIVLGLVNLISKSTLRRWTEGQFEHH